MERAERMVLLAIGLAFDILVPVLWISGPLGVTAVHRFVKCGSRRRQRPTAPSRHGRHAWRASAAAATFAVPDDAELAGGAAPVR
jgi:hypothetical protein